MLIGQYESKVSEKHQVAFPKRFREVLGKKLIITKGLDGCLICVSESNWKILLEGTEGKPFTQKNAREVQRFLLGNAAEIELDTKGRFVIPEFLRIHAEIDEDVVFAGIERFVEIWNKINWEKLQEKLEESIEITAENVSKVVAENGGQHD